MVPTTAPAAVTPPAADPTPPAVADLQQLLDQKQFPAALKAAMKLLGQRGPAAAGFSRFQVTMLKGDAQLGSKATGTARTTYLSAVRESRDPREQALAIWTAELVHRAHGTNYVPHVAGAGGGNNAPIDLVDRDTRKVAFAALLEDELSVMSPQIRTATRSGSLPQILPTVRAVQSLTALDEIANGSDARTSATAGGLLDHARNLMTNALKGMWTRVNDIHSSATQQTTAGGNTTYVNGQVMQQTVTGQNGLTAADVAELKDVIDTCGKVHDAAQTFMPLANGGADKEWGAILNDANRVAGRARDVLQGNYSGTTTSTTGSSDNSGVSGGGGIGASGVAGGVVIGGGYSGTQVTAGGQSIDFGTTPGGYPNGYAGGSSVHPGGAAAPTTPGSPAGAGTPGSPGSGSSGSGTSGGGHPGTSGGGVTTPQPTTPPPQPKPDPNAPPPAGLLPNAGRHNK